MKPCPQPTTPRRSFGGEHIGRTPGSRRPEAGIAARVVPAPTSRWTARERLRPTFRLDSCWRSELSTTLNPGEGSRVAFLVWAKPALPRPSRSMPGWESTISRTDPFFGAETLGPCKVLIPVSSYGGYCHCETDRRNGDGICVKATMKWDAYEKCGGLTDPDKEIGKTICVPKNKRYGREIICTRETNWANLATFLGAGIGTGMMIGALYGSPTGPVGAAVTSAVGGAVGGVAVMIGAFGCPVRTCTSTDGRTFPVPAVGVYGGDDCRNIDGKR